MSGSYGFSKEILPFIRLTSEQKSAVKTWWQAFEREQRKLCSYFNGSEEFSMDIPTWMKQSLQKIDKDLMWEFGPGLKKPHRLIISCEGNRKLRPLIQHILDMAPDYKDWEFYEYRLAE